MTFTYTLCVVSVQEQFSKIILLSRLITQSIQSLQPTDRLGSSNRRSQDEETVTLQLDHILRPLSSCRVINMNIIVKKWLLVKTAWIGCVELIFPKCVYNHILEGIRNHNKHVFKRNIILKFTIIKQNVRLFLVNQQIQNNIL